MKLGESIFQGLIYLTLFCFPPRKLTKCFIRILGGSFINNPASSCFTLFALYNFKGTVCLFFRDESRWILCQSSHTLLIVNPGNEGSPNEIVCHYLTNSSLQPAWSQPDHPLGRTIHLTW